MQNGIQLCFPPQCHRGHYNFKVHWNSFKSYCDFPARSKGGKWIFLRCLPLLFLSLLVAFLLTFSEGCRNSWNKNGWDTTRAGGNMWHAKTLSAKFILIVRDLFILSAQGEFCNAFLTKSDLTILQFLKHVYLSVVLYFSHFTSDIMLTLLKYHVLAWMYWVKMNNVLWQYYTIITFSV